MFVPEGFVWLSVDSDRTLDWPIFKHPNVESFITAYDELVIVIKIIITVNDLVNRL